MSIIATNVADIGKLIALGNGAEIGELCPIKLIEIGSSVARVGSSDDIYVTEDAVSPMSGGIFTMVRWPLVQKTADKAHSFTLCTAQSRRPICLHIQVYASESGHRFLYLNGLQLMQITSSR